MSDFKPKDQIAYVPHHANNSLDHPDVEYGFVMRSDSVACFCRFWQKGRPGVLRTISCSERTYNESLIKFKTCSPGEIDFIYNAIVGEDEETNAG